MDAATLCLAMIGFASLLSVFATIMAVLDRDLLRAALFSALQSTLYAFLFYVLMAPDIVLVYVAVAVGIYPLLIVLLIKKVGRFEEVGR